MSSTPAPAAYGYARLSLRADSLLGRFCRGREVVDLGAGRGGLSARMVALGATSVLAVEKEAMPAIPGVIHEQGYFGQLDPDVLPEHALLSWPTNTADCATVDTLGVYLAQRVQQILYIGLNDRFTVCGWLEMWEEFAYREVLDSVKVGHHNTVILYGARRDEYRQDAELLPEERAALAIARKWSRRHCA